MHVKTSAHVHPKFTHELHTSKELLKRIGKRQPMLTMRENRRSSQLYSILDLVTLKNSFKYISTAIPEWIVLDYLLMLPIFFSDSLSYCVDALYDVI